MNNPGLNTYQYPQKYNLPTKDGKNSAVNIYINGVNTPQPNYQYPYTMPPQPYVYYVPYNNAVSAQNVAKNSSKKTNSSTKVEKKSDKPVTPITAQLLKGLNEALLHGDKQTRMHSVARVINLKIS